MASMRGTLDDPRSDGPTLELLLARIATELDEAANGLKSVQDLLTDLPTSALSDDGMVTLQGLDLLEQTMRALSRILIDVSPRAAGVCDPSRPMLLETCRLSSLADRLRGVERKPDVGIELF